MSGEWQFTDFYDLDHGRKVPMACQCGAENCVECMTKMRDLGIMPCGCLQDELCDTHRTERFGASPPKWEQRVSGSTEVRVVDAKSGGAKGSKLARFDLIPPEALWELAEHYGRGAEKYPERNWEKGYKWGLSVAALQRHLQQWLMGETHDEETGGHHLIAVAWHAFALFTYDTRHLGTDDVTHKETV